MTRARFIPHQPIGVSAASVDDVVRFGQRVSEWVEGFYAVTPWADGVILEDVALVLGNNDVEHKLGRKLRGWEIVLGHVSPCDFELYLAADQTGVVASTWTKVAHDTEAHDVGNNVASATFTAPHAGLYQFAAYLLMTDMPDGTLTTTGLYLNGSQRMFGAQGRQGSAGRGSSVTVQQSISLAEGDTIEQYGLHTSSTGNESFAGNATPDGRTRFSGRAIVDLFDRQADSGLDTAKYLRLYSSMARTVSLKVW